MGEYHSCRTDEKSSLISIQRRKFIQLTALGSAALYRMPADTFASKPLVLKKSLKYSMINSVESIAEKFIIAKQAGFDGVEPDSRLNWQEVARAAQESNMAVPGRFAGSTGARPFRTLNSRYATIA